MEPTNELGVIVLFSQQCEMKGWSIVRIQAAFPDVEIADKYGKVYRAEFEYFAGSFKAHGHDPRDCD